MKSRPSADRSNKQAASAAIAFVAVITLWPLINVDAREPRARNQKDHSVPRPKLTSAEEQLRRESRKAILDTGFSEQYFDQHFSLERVFNQPGDRRVVWKFSLNQYRAMLNDAIGYYSSDLGERVNTHSITATLQSSHDIEKTITLKRADQIIRNCIGRYDLVSFMLGVQSSTGRSGLYMIASSRGRREPLNEEAGQKKRSSKNESPNINRAQETDSVPREGGDNEKPLVYAVLDLETGKCVKAKALVAP